MSKGKYGGRIVLDWTSWLRLLVSPSSYLFVLALLATALAKTISLLALHPPVEWWVLPASMLLDVTVFMGAAGAFAWLEAYIRFVGWLTVPVAAAAALVAALNAIYLALAGEQLSWSIFEIIARQWAEAETVLRSMLQPILVAFLVLVLALLSGVSIGLRKLLRLYAGPWNRCRHGQMRACCAWLFAVPAAILSYALPAPSLVDSHILGKNAFVIIVQTATNRFEKGSFVGYQHKRLVSDAFIDAFASGERPNVLFYFLESTRYDHTSLAPAGIRQAETPVLARLAARGVVGHQVRTVLPHTTKAIFSILCARLPTMQRGVIEVSHDPALQCLPSILRRAGYRTAFFQSAVGSFEQRPRLVEKFGYEHFEAAEDLQGVGGGEVLGYLASEDETLAPALTRWLDASDRSQPFFATLLTSAVHHPYRLPRKLHSRLARDGQPIETPAQRYARLVEETDRVLGLLLEMLRERQLLDNTLILVVGDHGEGFGDHGVLQHDNNYFEEGLRVPLVLAGPGIEPGRIDHNVSLIDITPTLLAHWNMALVPELRGGLLGRNFLDPGFDTRGVPRFFGCCSFMRCRGFVVDGRKLVYLPWNDKTWVFDLAADPDEDEPVGDGDDLREHVGRLHTLIDGHRTSEWSMVYKEVRYGDWLCPEGSPLCLHPRAADARYRLDEGDKTKGKPVEEQRTLDEDARKPAHDGLSPVGAKDCGHLGSSWKENPDSTSTVIECKTSGLL